MSLVAGKQCKLRSGRGAPLSALCARGNHQQSRRSNRAEIRLHLQSSRCGPFSPGNLTWPAADEVGPRAQEPQKDIPITVTPDDVAPLSTAWNHRDVVTSVYALPTR
jgi:hypothetical protein